MCLGFGTYLLTNQSTNECAPEEKPVTYERNKLEKRAFVLQYPANQPCEDRFNCYQFKSQDAYYAAVFDGHGGWQVSDHAMRHLHTYLDEELKGAKTDAQIQQAIINAYNRVEKDWVELAKNAFDKGYPATAYVGSCALVAVVKDNKLYVANAGDSKAALLSKTKEGTYLYKKVSVTYNANKSYEQERLKKLFPKEDDIIKCKGRDQKACYVKGNLMPTRAFGDLRLKMAEFNFHNHPIELGYRNPIPKFNGPYITHQPTVEVVELTNDDQFLVLASDGLWDEIPRKKVPEIVQGKDTDI